MKNKTQKRKIKGVVVSDKMTKTRIVEVSRYTKHPKYKKYLKRSKRYKAHDEKEVYKIGDKVIMQETRPVSKDKKFKIIGLAK